MQYIVMTEKRVLQINARSIQAATRSLASCGIKFLSVTPLILDN